MKRKLVLIICLIVCFLCISQIVINYINKKTGTSFYNSTLPSHNEVNIEKIQEKYENILGYIKIEGTNINYPIVQGEDNNYYLSHLPNGEKNKMGSIYLDYRNNGFDDDNTIIYGHNMNDGTMFSELENYKRNDYYKNHKSYMIYTESGNLKVEILAAYIADASKEGLPINFEDDEREKYLQKVAKSNILDSNVNIKVEDKIITLCTCADVYDTSRLVLIGKVL